MTDKKKLTLKEMVEQSIEVYGSMLGQGLVSVGSVEDLATLVRLKQELDGGTESDLAQKEMAHAREMVLRTFPKLSSMRETDEISSLTDDMAKVLNSLTQKQRAIDEAWSLLSGAVGRVPAGLAFAKVAELLNGIRDVLQKQRDDDGA